MGVNVGSELSIAPAPLPRHALSVINHGELFEEPLAAATASAATALSGSALKDARFVTASHLSSAAVFSN
jgi:hypothetical protein